MLKPLAGALVGGAVGAGVWAAVAYFANLEIGWIAWGVGVLAGLGARLAAPERLSLQTGVAAALIAVVSVAGGKYLSVHLALERALADAGVGDDGALVDDELATSYFADEVVMEHMQAGEPVRWPGGVVPENPCEEREYPRDVWAEAAERYAALSPQERTQYKAELTTGIQASLREFRSEAQQAGFRESFGMLDLLFVALAIGSAFKLGSGEALAQA